MRVLFIFLLTTFVAIGVLAKPPADLSVPSSSSTSELRRSELRAALKSSLGANGRRKEQAVDKSPDKRHLTPQERADLRQQLRQHLMVVGPDLP
jgi:hypothetical protein